jgi:hypothetical protein
LLSKSTNGTSFSFLLLLLPGHHWYNISQRHPVCCSLIIVTLILVMSLPINKRIRLKILVLGVKIRRSGQLKTSPFLYYLKWSNQLACFSDSWPLALLIYSYLNLLTEAWSSDMGFWASLWAHDFCTLLSSTVSIH